MPNIHSPTAIIHLPTSGCTTLLGPSAKMPSVVAGVDDLCRPRCRCRRCVVDERSRVVLDQQRVRVLGVVRLVERDVVRSGRGSRTAGCRRSTVMISGASQPHSDVAAVDGGVSRRRSRGSGSPSTVRPSSATAPCCGVGAQRRSARLGRRRRHATASSYVAERDSSASARRAADCDDAGMTLVLAATPIGRVDDASPRLARRAGRAPTWSPPRTPAGCAGWPRDLGVDADRRASCRTSRATRRQRTPRAARGAARRASGSCWSPTPACRASPTPATGWWRPRSRPASRSPPCPGPSAVLTALAVSGCRSTGSASRASCRARRASGARRLDRARRRAAHDGLLRGAAPDRRRRSRRWPRRSAPTARRRSAAS